MKANGIAFAIAVAGLALAARAGGVEARGDALGVLSVCAEKQLKEQCAVLKSFVSAFLTAVHKADPGCPTSVLVREDVREVELVSGVSGLLKAVKEL